MTSLYATFNDFFTRALAPGARPIAPAQLVCPVDGAISQLGAIDGAGRITDEGRRLRSLPLPPRLARMVVDAAA